MGFGMEKGGGGNGHRVIGVLCAKLNFHKITPNTQGIRHYDVMISGEVQSLALPQILRETQEVSAESVTVVKQSMRGMAVEGLINHLNYAKGESSNSITKMPLPKQQRTVKHWWCAIISNNMADSDEDKNFFIPHCK